MSLAAAVSALEQERDRLRDLCSDIIGCIAISRAHGTITSANELEFDKTINAWSRRFSQINQDEYVLPQSPELEQFSRTVNAMREAGKI